MHSKPIFCMICSMDDVRVQKVKAIRANGGIPYAAKFDRSHNLSEAKDQKDGSSVTIAGKVMLHRDMGKMGFVTLQDHTGRLQLSFQVDQLGEEDYKRVME